MSQFNKGSQFNLFSCYDIVIDYGLSMKMLKLHLNVELRDSSMLRNLVMFFNNLQL
jgi:hypothetical protein